MRLCFPIILRHHSDPFRYCTNLAYEFVETVEISPHTSTHLLQEAKAVRESLLLLVQAAEEEERGVTGAATRLQTACQLVAANVTTCIEAASAPLKDLLPGTLARGARWFLFWPLLNYFLSCEFSAATFSGVCMHDPGR